MNKSKLRKEAADRRRKMPSFYREKASALIAQRLFSMKEWQESERVFLYYGYGPEVGTEALIDTALSDGKQVFLPKVISDKEMVFIRISSRLEDTAAGAYGIPEPLDKGIYETGEPDLIIVPCVAVDERGDRIGHGKGYYDRYLSEHTGAVRICLAFECQTVERFEADDNDVRMDAVITESRTIREGLNERKE